MSKVFIVSGASKGIGAAVTRYLLSQQHKVVLTARSADLLESVKAAHPGQVEYVAGDMTDPTVFYSPFSHTYIYMCIRSIEACGMAN